MIRLLLVEDSITQREILRSLIDRSGEFVIVAEGRNGREAVALVEKYQPDVVLMDIHMPDVDGVAATRQIMQRNPVPIVIVSASLRISDVDLGLEAIRAGAVTVIEKPQGPVLLHLEEIGPQLRSQLVAASKARVVRRQTFPGKSTGSQIAARANVDTIDVIGICASTGGPPVLVEILSQLPKPYPLPILLVQHIAEGFMEGFGRWLGESSGQTVRSINRKQALKPGVWISPGGRHLVCQEGGTLHLMPRQPGEIHCPSGDMLFDSIARWYGPRGMGIVLTGMGDDGVNGLLALNRAGGRTIAQDEASSLIYGMPKAAHERGAAQLELPPEGIVQILKQAAEA